MRVFDHERRIHLHALWNGDIRDFASPEALERFLAEAEAAANLRHVHIVTVFDYGEWEGVPFFTMEYIEGRTLGETTGDWGLGMADRGLGISKMVRTIAEAVDYAHQQGVLHRDLKPSNILIDRHGEPRITDFGLAKHIRNESDLTLTGHLLGSPNYMSPEQASGIRAVIGPSSDVYALGAIRASNSRTSTPNKETPSRRSISS